MKLTLIRLSAIALLMCFAVQANAQTSLISVFSAQVEEDEIDAFTDGEDNTVIDQAFFNVQGDDDAFTVYSLVDFDTSSIGAIASITDISLDITQSNAFFSADGALEFFLASDTREVTLDDTARYQTDGDNIGAEVVGDAFGTLFAVGSGTYTETESGNLDSFSLSLDAAGEAFAIAQINSGGILRVIATPGDLGVQATYSGASSILDPAAPPVLDIAVTAVPEPSSIAFLLLGISGIAIRRKRN